MIGQYYSLFYPINTIIHLRASVDLQSTMVRELVTIQVGQCGNQIGRQFWQLALEEHAKVRSHARPSRDARCLAPHLRPSATL
jgi:hypothetical protein